MKWHEIYSISSLFGILIALFFLSMHITAKKEDVSSICLEKIKVVGLGDSPQVWEFILPASTPVGQVLQKIELDEEIDIFEIYTMKKIGLIVSKRLILPKKGMKSAIFEEKINGAMYRFDLAHSAKKEDLFILVAAKLGVQVAKKVLGRKRKLFHIEHFFFYAEKEGK